MKVLLLGIDAFDRLLFEQFAPDLPNLSALRAGGVQLEVRSTFPPDSDTAWATIYTGLNPAQHGIVRFIDPLEKSYQILNASMQNNILRTRTFWELIGQAGYQAHAIFPHLCYPVWDTPGILVGRGSSQASIEANKAAILDDYPDPDFLYGVRGFPDRNLSAMRAYARRLAGLARADAEFALKLMQEYDWDLFFTYWSTLDAIGHFFWNYFDPQDPNFEEGHPLQAIIPQAYQLYDELLGRFLAAVDQDTTVIMMSDHGHGARPFKLVSVNDVLRQAGFLQARSLKTNPHLNFFEKGKRLAVQTVSRLGVARMAGQIMRHFPGAIQSFTRPASVNWEKTLAYATDMSGIKSYSYGGVIINHAALGNKDYETVRTEIMDLLKETCLLADGTSLLKFIARREDLYSGPYLARYPDIILEFIYGYGVGWALNVPLVTRADSYNLVPGSHRGDTGFFVIRSSRSVRVDRVDLQDITPTLLDLFGIPTQQTYLGSSILS